MSRVLGPIAAARKWLGLLPTIVRLSRDYLTDQGVFAHPLPEVAGKTCDRESMILDLAAGKRVLHYGFVDAPFSSERIQKGLLLHQRLQTRAAFLYGADVNAESLQLYEQLTGDRNYLVLDVHAPPQSQPALAQGFDLLLFTEILEHLGNPLLALQNLRQVCQLNPGCRLCITVPNAFFIGGFWAAANGIEIVHPEHYYYYSPYTLKNLLSAAGFSQVDIQLYASADLMNAPGLIKNGVMALCKA